MDSRLVHSPEGGLIPTAPVTLLPCPFCGGTEYHLFNSPDEFGRPSHGVQCANGNCWIVGPECETAEEAQTAWNRRPPIGETGAALATCREALAVARETLEKIARATPESTDSETAKDMAEWAHCAAVVGLVSAFSKDGIARQQAAPVATAQPGTSAASAPSSPNPGASNEG